MPVKLPSKKHWRTYRLWKGWPKPAKAWYVDRTRKHRKDTK
jgi:hypothetical protein